MACVICGAGTVVFSARNNNHSKFWRSSDSGINLPMPPNDLFDSEICHNCYNDGPTMERRIRTVLGQANTIYGAYNKRKSKVMIGQTKCECGGEKCGTTHSNWCPKY